MDKHIHRQRSKKQREALSPEARVLAGDGIRVGVEALLDGRAPAVLAYAPTADEVDVAPLVESLRARGARVAYPRVCAPGELTLHWAGPEDLTPGYCGILEPPADASPVPPAEIDVVLVPGVAFDASCCRLGHGGGFYDRLLPRLAPDALIIGIAFDEQIVDPLPREEHDILMDVIVTPTRVLRRG